MDNSWKFVLKIKKSYLVPRYGTGNSYKSTPAKNIFVKHSECAPRKEIIRTFAAVFQNDISMINITFPDNSVRQYEAGVTPLDIAKSLSEGLARNVLSAKVNGKMWDAMRPVNEDATIQLFTWDDPEGKATFWHSSAHLMAEAIEALYKGVKFGIGPAVDAGF